MKSLLLLRHAKSSWSDPGLADIDRPLNKRGKRDAPRMGTWMREMDLVPDLILSSPAKRARRTAEAVCDASGFNGGIEVVRDFYPGDPETFIEFLATIPEEVARVMIVAHNPGLEELVDELCGESVRLPTAALVQISLPLDSWQEFDDEVEGKLENLWRVKEIL
jgi:phosphohistidine phosphatase